MITGFNHNFRYKGHVYHIQTEDSGLKAPHIISHVFVGGNIIASKKTSYADLLGTPNLEEVIKELMEEQHKAMLRNLKNGMYDTDEQKEISNAGVKIEGEKQGDEEDIFGKDLISDKPLDEVILNYLFADEDGG